MAFFRQTPKQELFVVSHTHWDREWHQPFQTFRFRLVQVIDDLLALLAENPDFRHFTLDGQTVVLEDYLAVRPDRRAELAHHIGTGRIQIGPWYVMPDEFLVSPEALVRNLLWGTRQAREFGALMPIGYLPDPFGHISQLPQILAGFGIDTAVLWRGIGRRTDRSEFEWVAPDGSAVLVLYLVQSYNNAAQLPSNRDQLLHRIGQIRAELTPYATTPVLLLLNGDDHQPAQPNLPALIRQANGQLRDAELTHGTLGDVVARLRDHARANGVRWERVSGEFRSSELAHLLAGILSTRIWIKQRNARCEDVLERWAEPFTLFAGMVTERRPFERNESMVGQAAQPFVRLAWQHLLHCHPHDSICGCSIDQVHREMVTRFDACEQVAEEVSRHALTAIAAQVDTASATRPRGVTPPARGTRNVVVFNSEDHTRDDLVSVVIEPPDGSDDFRIIAPDGTSVPYQVMGQETSVVLSESLSREQVQAFLRLAGGGSEWSRWRIGLLERMVGLMTRGRLPQLTLMDVEVRPSGEHGVVDLDVDVVEHGSHNYEALARGLRHVQALVDRGDVEIFRLRARRRDRVTVAFVASDVPPKGYRTFQIVRPQSASTGLVSRIPRLPQSTRETVLENEFLSARIDPHDGTLTVVDKDNGTIYEGLNNFVDGGDAGDTYTYSPPLEDLIVDRPAGACEIEVVADGPARRTVKVTMTYQVPSELSEDRQSRSNDRVPLRITTSYSVSPGIRRIDVQTVVDNAAKDHLLRVRFPTPLFTSFADADGHFVVERRPIGPPTETAGWLEQPVATQPQRLFVDVSDGAQGLMIVNRGLPEYEVTRTNGHVAVALTLLRCVGWLSRGDLRTRHGAAGPMIPTPEAQCPGQHVFEYSIVPHAGDWRKAASAAIGFRYPLRAMPLGQQSGTLPPELSFLAVSPPSLRISAVKFPEEGDGIVVRVSNCHEDTHAELRTFRPMRRVRRVRLDEEVIEELPVDEDRIRFFIRSGQILTFAIELAS